MSRPSIDGLCLLFCLLQPLATFGQQSDSISQEISQVEKAATDQASDPIDFEKVKEAIVKQTNRLRQREKREPLTANPELAEAAQDFAAVLAEMDKLDHNADGKQPWDRTTEAGYQHSIVSENIAYQSISPSTTPDELAEKFLLAWENSAGHRKNLLDPDVMDLGVGLGKHKSSGRYYAVQNFGRPKSANIKFKITNETKSSVNCSIDGESFTIDPGFTITFERSRPPELRFIWKETDQVSDSAKQTLHPIQGANYAVRTSAEGLLTVATTQPASKE